METLTKLDEHTLEVDKQGLKTPYTYNDLLGYLEIAESRGKWGIPYSQKEVDYWVSLISEADKLNIIFNPKLDGIWGIDYT